MPLQPLPGFQHFTTHHCVTGSMRHIYVFNGHPFSEEMLLGLGAGVSFSYWHFKGQPPFLGGRGMPKPSMEELAGQRTGVRVTMQTTASARKARQALLEMLNAGQPVMVQCDMGYLPYFDFGGHEYHFGGHVVVVCGYDLQTDQVLIADRDEPLHTVPMEALEQARCSPHKPFPPKNLWYTFDFSDKRAPTTEEIRQAIREQVVPMLAPSIQNIGVKGIRKAAESVVHWSELLSPEELRWALFNAAIFITPVGGSGGGCFRYMFSRFLREAAPLIGELRLEGSADEFQRIGDAWEGLGNWCQAASQNSSATARLDEAAAMLHALADQEEVAWTRLAAII